MNSHTSFLLRPNRIVRYYFADAKSLTTSGFDLRHTNLKIFLGQRVMMVEPIGECRNYELIKGSKGLPLACRFQRLSGRVFGPAREAHKKTTYVSACTLRYIFSPLAQKHSG